MSGKTQKKKRTAAKPVKEWTGGDLFPDYERGIPGNRVIYNVWGTLVVIGAVLTSIPFIWMVVTAMLPIKMMFAPISEVAKNFTIDFTYFEKAWSIAPFVRYFFNSLLVAGCVVAGQLIISAMAAYSLSKLKPPLYGLLMILFVSTILIPFETIAIPLYLFMRDFTIAGFFKINLVNSYWALILPGLANAMNIFIFKSFFDKLPDDFLEAARIDGYNEIPIFFNIIMPVSKPIFAVLGIMNFVNIWNSFFWPLIVVNEPDIYTLMLGIYKIIEEGQPWNIVMAAVTISIIPTVAMFVLFQKYIMQGVVFTSLQE
jgi:ABC-type glycerol-3-phosphate transport system permease component